MTQTLTPEEATRWLDGILSVMDEPRAREPLKRWGQELAGELGTGFLRSESPTGQKWPPLKRRRPKGHNQGIRPLIDFGDLMLSVISDSPDHIERITDDSIVFGTSDFKAAFHQFGTRVIPPRPFLGVSDEMADRATELLAEHQITSINVL